MKILNFNKFIEFVNKYFFFGFKRYLILNLKRNNKLLIFVVIYNILSITLILLTPFVYLIYDNLENYKLIFEYLNNFLNSNNNFTYSVKNLLKNSNLVSNEINLLDNNNVDNFENSNFISNNKISNDNNEKNNLLIENLDSKIEEINENNNKYFYKNKIFLIISGVVICGSIFYLYNIDLFPFFNKPFNFNNDNNIPHISKYIEIINQHKNAYEILRNDYLKLLEDRNNLIYYRELNYELLKEMQSLSNEFENNSEKLGELLNKYNN